MSHLIQTIILIKLYKVETNEALSYRSEPFPQQKIGQKAITVPPPLSLQLSLLNRREKNEQNRNLKLTHQTKSSAPLRKPLLCNILLLATKRN